MRLNEPDSVQFQPREPRRAHPSPYVTNKPSLRPRRLLNRCADAWLLMCNQRYSAFTSSPQAATLSRVERCPINFKCDWHVDHLDLKSRSPK